MSWKFVFKHVQFTFSRIEDIAFYAYNGGYTFFEWNGVVWFVYEIVTDEVNISFLDTGIRSGDLV